MKVAVTGGIGSGKSTVAKMLASRLGGVFISADAICRDLLKPGTACLQKLRKVVPHSCFLNGGALDRAALRQAIFSDKSLRQQVDGVIHPQVRKEIHRLCEEKGDPVQVVVIEVPLLFETGWQTDFDCTLLVYADNETCVRRIMERDQVDEQAARSAVAAQMDIEDKVQLSDLIIDNSSSLAESAEHLEYLVETDAFIMKTKRGMNNT